MNRKNTKEMEAPLEQVHSEMDAVQINPTLPAGYQRNMEAEAEIDLLELARVLWDKIHYIILCFLIGAVVMNAVAFFGMKPTYESTAKMYIVSASNDSVVDLTDLNIGTSLTQDYEQLILSNPVLEQVIEELELDMEPEDLAEMIALNNPADTRILDITATSTDPKQARDIANKVMEVSIEYLPETMSTNPPNVVQAAKIAKSKAAPSYAKYTMMGALLGACLCCGYLIVMYLLDDSIHTPDDMEKYFGIVPLTTIPESDVFPKDVEEETERTKSLWKGRKKA